STADMSEHVPPFDPLAATQPVTWTVSNDDGDVRSRKHRRQREGIGRVVAWLHREVGRREHSGPPPAAAEKAARRNAATRLHARDAGREHVADHHVWNG